MNKIKIKQCVYECINTVNQKDRLLQKQTRCFPVPHIRFDIRGKTAGMALLQRWELRFNPVLLDENLDAFLQEVVPHEICHLLAFAKFGHARPHGQEWKNLMCHYFNLKPKTTHSFDVSSVLGKIFLYQCECGPLHLSIRRHNKVQRKEAQYICRVCKKQFLYSLSI